MLFDTIGKTMSFHLEKPWGDLRVVTDSIHGIATYQLTLGTDEPEKETPSSQFLLGLLIGLMVVALVVGIGFWFKRRRVKPLSNTSSNDQDPSSRELFRQSDAYKALKEKGYFSVNKNLALEMVKGQEINALCDAVTAAYPSFSEWLHRKECSEKEIQFCCLVKSGLSTFELAEIYCVSESAIFKRKQKMKERLGLKADSQTLDGILQTL